MDCHCLLLQTPPELRPDLSGPSPTSPPSHTHSPGPSLDEKVFFCGSLGISGPNMGLHPCFLPANLPSIGLPEGSLKMQIKGWRCGSSSRVYVFQEQSPEFKSHYGQRERERKRERERIKLQIRSCQTPAQTPESFPWHLE
jgi:hypothetical protein